MKIMVFLHGTTIMHKNALGRTREERVKQVIYGEKSADDFSSYLPIGNAARKLQGWGKQEAEICYLSSHKKAEDVQKDQAVLHKYRFPNGPVYYCHADESYQDVAEQVLPDVLIEDDCECIGGEIEMTYPHLKPELKVAMKSIVVKEFGGIDHLPDDVSALLSYK